MAFELPSNFSNGTAVDGVGSLFKYASYVTGNAMGYGLLIAIFFISFVVGASANAARSFGSAIFITFIFSIYFARIEMVNPTIPFILASLTIVGWFWAKSEKASY